ncbi:hypothetical protein [Haloplanus pelagicus]|uniref:hypothetical protein n=1 Tax=Haloplanus pelagicus TaxID=2949995 RepID=UPI00203B7C58|nr:hypothetical protein [Haloplanus sp. HW8-1]
MTEDDSTDSVDDQERRLAQFERWMDATGLVVDSGMKYAMHDSLYSNPDQAEAYEEASELGVDGLAYAIWKLGWDFQVDGWVYDEELGWQQESTIEARDAEDDSTAEDEQTEYVLSDFPLEEESESDESWVYYVGPEGNEGWQNMDTGTISRRKKRPGSPPDGGDGYDDWLAGWKRPPEPDDLDEGQLLEVQTDDRDPELAVVTATSDDGIRIRIEHPPEEEDGLSILAVEDENFSAMLDVPGWVEPYRDG